MSQNAYNAVMEEAVAGLVFGDTKDIATRKTPDNAIKFGRFVAKGTGDEEIIPFSSSGAVVEGISVRDVSHVEGYYPAEEPVGVLKLGRIWIESETAIGPDSSVYVCYAGRKQKQTITFDADLVTSNKINMTVDGVAMTEVDFTSDHSTTMTAICTQLLTDFPNKFSAVTKTGRIITATVYTNGVDVVIADVEVTAGATQAAAVVAETVTGITDEEAYGKIRADADSPTRAVVKASGIKVLRTVAAGKYAPCQINVF